MTEIAALYFSGLLLPDSQRGERSRRRRRCAAVIAQCPARVPSSHVKRLFVARQIYLRHSRLSGGAASTAAHARARVQTNRRKHSTKTPPISPDCLLTLYRKSQRTLSSPFSVCFLLLLFTLLTWCTLGCCASHTRPLIGVFDTRAKHQLLPYLLLCLLRDFVCEQKYAFAKTSQHSSSLD